MRALPSLCAGKAPVVLFLELRYIGCGGRREFADGEVRR
jgi:hypothetical protein